MFNLNVLDKNSFWYTHNHELIEVNPNILHSIDVIKNYKKLGIPFSEIIAQVKKNENLNIQNDLKEEELSLFYKECDSEEKAEGFKLLGLKHNNITIRTTFMKGDNRFVVVINYYGELGLKLLKTFATDYSQILKRREILIYDVKTDTYNTFNDIKELLNL